MWVFSVIIAVVALYGAVLSTVNYLSERASLRVKAVLGYIADNDGVSDLNLFLRAANTGNRPITINSLGYEAVGYDFDLTERNPISHVSFPYEVMPGKCCEVWGPPERLVEPILRKGVTGKVKIRPVVGDQTGKTHRGSAFEVNPEEWAVGNASIPKKKNPLSFLKRRKQTS